jgi:anti-sigma B factor antagonist
LTITSALTVARLCEPERSVVAARGEVDISSCTRLDDAVHQVLEAGTDELVLNLAGVTFIDSTGLACILDALARCRETGTRLRLRPSTQVRRALDLTMPPPGVGCVIDD